MNTELTETEERLLLEEAQRRQLSPAATERLLELARTRKLKAARYQSQLETKAEPEADAGWYHFRYQLYAKRDGDTLLLRDVTRGEEFSIDLDLFEALVQWAQSEGIV